MRTVVVGGVATGMSAAARLRRLDETAEIIVLEKGPYVSYANCGLPYYVGGEIEDDAALLVQTPEKLRAALNLDVRTGHEVVGVDAEAKTVMVRSGDGEDVLHYLFELAAEKNLTLVIVTHNESVAARCRRHVVLRDGLPVG